MNANSTAKTTEISDLVDELCKQNEHTRPRSIEGFATNLMAAYRFYQRSPH